MNDTSANIAIIDGGSNSELAHKISSVLDVELHGVAVTKFNDGETGVQIQENIRGKDVFIIQSTSHPVNENFMNLLILVDAIRRASARTITAVIPYFGYARQDRKDSSRTPITAKLVANMLTTAGVTRVVTVDLHAHQIQGFFDIPLDHLYARGVFMNEITKLSDDFVIVSPDVGGAKMAEGFSSRLGVEMAILHKKRVDDLTTKMSGIVGDVSGKDVIIVDDIVATAGSLKEAAKILRKAGAKKIYCAISHGVLSGPAIARIESSDIDELLITDSIALPKEKQHKKIRIISVAPLIATAIERITQSSSVIELHER